MKKRNALIILAVIISLVCALPSFVTRIDYESSHTCFEVAPVLTPDIAEKELEFFKENGITLLISDETDSDFDHGQIQMAKELGFDIALRINIGEKCEDGFEEKLDLLVKENDIKYMLISRHKDAKNYDAPLERVIKDNAMTVVVCENIKQLSNEMPKGYERYLDAAGGRLMRCYTTLKNPAGGLNSEVSPHELGELLYHHMANSLCDRNTEFMALNVIENSSVTRDEAIRQTVNAAKRFKEHATRSGYEEGKNISLKGYETNLRLASSASVMICFIMALVMIEILLKKRMALLEWSFCIFAYVAFGLVYILPQRLILLVPSAFAPMSSMFSFSVTMATIKHVKDKGFSFFSSTFIVFASALISLLLGAVFLGAMLSGTDYYLNNLIFRGVKLSLVLPVLYSLAFVWIYENNRLNLSCEGIRKVFSKIRLSHIIALAIAATALFVYVTRSGNAKISPFENAFRNFVSEISGVRPRTKEFAIGWPCLALSVYLSYRSMPKLLKELFFVGSSVLFASVTNTFCHVFADFSVSALRTLNGLLFSIPVIALLILCAKLFDPAKKKRT